jgi:hypothetical protein
MSVCQVLDGEPGGIPKFVGHWLLRSALMMPGLALAGIRDKRLVTGALFSSTFVSLFLVAYTAFERQRKGRYKRSRTLGSRPTYSRRYLREHANTQRTQRTRHTVPVLTQGVRK